MAETPLQERTEAATPRRRERARRSGQVPRSTELTTAVLLLASALALHLAGGALGGGLLSVVGQGLAMVGAGALDGAAAVSLVQGVGRQALAAVTPLVLTLAGAALAVSAAQARGVVSLSPLAPRWSRLDPAANARRIFGAQAWVELLRALIKVLVVGAAVYLSMSAVWTESLALVQESPFALLLALRSHSVRLLLSAGLAYLVFAALDYLYQVWRFERGLRMTRPEVLEEKRQEEGDPNVRARLRTMGRALLRGPSLRAVADADLVITGAGGLAVALEYDPELAEAPVALAIGRLQIASRIVAVARQAGVPVLEDRSLAEALAASAAVGAPIPPEHYLAVAEALASVMSRRASRAGGVGA